VQLDMLAEQMLGAHHSWVNEPHAHARAPSRRGRNRAPR
jgi:hypothetical protein